MADLDAAVDGIPTAWGGHRAFAVWLAMRTKADVIVDLGVDCGFSSLCWASTGVRQVFGIDSFEGDKHAGFRDTMPEVLNRIQDHGLYNLHLVKGYFDEVALNWKDRIDILHIDGRHDYEDVKSDYLAWRSFVREGGVVLFHDTEVPHFGVRKLLDRIDLPKLNFKNSHGLGVVSSNHQLLSEIAELFKENL